MLSVMASMILFSNLALGTLIFAIILRIVFVIFQGRRNRKKAVGFFHPNTNDGGGGERVLWCAVKAVQEECSDLDCVIYTGNHGASSQSLSARAEDRFGVELIRPPKVVYLYRTKWSEASTYSRFTLLCQGIGSMYLSWEALLKFTPLYFFDTTGHAFTYPVARMFGCTVICYTHYPTISVDMISRVHRRSSMYNNDALIANSLFLSQGKVIYFKFIIWLYGFLGSHAHLAMVNSSWTESHIQKLWGIPARIKRVYPPCDTSSLQVQPLERPLKPMNIISVAQFRPEKAHILQLEAFALAMKNLDADLPRPKLQFVGGCRNDADEKRLQHLRDRASELKMEHDVEFHIDVPYSELVSLLGGATAGIHSMIDEHFGICVVEYMAAGAIPIAHNSAGPKMDIVLPEDGKQTGFLACSMEEFADAILKVINMPETERMEMAALARKQASKFSEQRFYQDFKVAIRPIMNHTSR